MKQLCFYAATCAIDPVKTGANIRNLRHKRGISVAALSDFFLIARNSVYKWERGDSLPSLDNLYSLAWIFDVTVDELLVGNRDALSSVNGTHSIPA